MNNLNLCLIIIIIILIIGFFICWSINNQKQKCNLHQYDNFWTGGFNPKQQAHSCQVVGSHECPEGYSCVPAQPYAGTTKLTCNMTKNGGVCENCSFGFVFSNGNIVGCQSKTNPSHEKDGCIII